MNRLPSSSLTSLMVGLVTIVALGCSGGGNGDRARIGLPAGDVEAGRRVFATKGCTLCHRAAGETNLPAPTSTTPGPELGPLQKDWSQGGLARAIVQPEHREALSSLPGTPDHPMTSMRYADELTVRELADLLAYIRYLGE